MQNEKITIYIFPGVLIMLVRVNIAATATLHEKLCFFDVFQEIFITCSKRSIFSINVRKMDNAYLKLSKK